MSDNVVQHPLAERSSQKIKRAEIEAKEKAAPAQHRRYLKETKSKRDRERAIYKRRIAAESHVSDVIWRAAYLKVPQTQPLSDTERGVAFEKAFFTISETVEAAVQASAAKAAGYDSWTALKAAEE